MTEMNKIYAGIGSRETPPEITLMMLEVAVKMDSLGWTLRSGNANGADTAFQSGTTNKEIHLPWLGYNQAPEDDSRYLVPITTPQMCQVAADHHPYWANLKNSVRLLMVRNVTIILGQYLLNPVSFVCCWTPGGQLKGGTAHGIKVALTFHIPVFNLANHKDQTALANFVAKHG